MYFKHILATVLMICAGSGCDKLNGESRPQRSEPCLLELTLGAAFDPLGAGLSTSGIFLTVVCEDDFLRVWDWRALSAAPVSVGIPHWRRAGTDIRYGVFLQDSQVVIAVPQKTTDSCVLVQKDAQSGEEKTRWDLGVHVECCGLWPSPNAENAVVLVREKYNFVLKQGRQDQGDHQIAVLTPGKGEIVRLATIRGEKYGPYINTVAVSEDLKYFAAAGYMEGGWICVGSVRDRKELWRKRPRGAEVPLGGFTVNFNDCAFSPDGQRVYVAGNMGLFCFDVKSGTILSQWPCNGRFIKVAVSSDGKYVAAGNTLTGIVELWEAASGRHVCEIKTGQYTVYGLAFCPDSTMLATAGTPPENPSVKIWKIADLLGRANTNSP